MESPLLHFSRLTQKSEKLPLSCLSRQNPKAKPLNQAHSSFFCIAFSFQSLWLLCYHVLLGPLLIIFLSTLNQAQDRQRARVGRAYVEDSGSRSLARSRCLGCVWLLLSYLCGDVAMMKEASIQWGHRCGGSSSVSQSPTHGRKALLKWKWAKHSSTGKHQYFWSFLIKKIR